MIRGVGSITGKKGLLMEDGSVNASLGRDELSKIPSAALLDPGEIPGMILGGGQAPLSPQRAFAIAAAPGQGVGWVDVRTFTGSF